MRFRSVGLLFSYIFAITVCQASCSSPGRFIRLSPLYRPRASGATPQEYEEITRPLPSDHLTPSCTHTLIRHSFANTINMPPFTASYSPPRGCTSPPWSHVVLHLRAASSGDQYDRISGLCLGGVELLRTSTAEPTPSGIFWEVRKDVSRYSSLFMKTDLNVTMMLENIVNDVYTGIYHINVSLLFYNDFTARASPNFLGSLLLRPRKFHAKLGFRGSKRQIVKDMLSGEDQPPADLIIPVADDGTRGYWFRIDEGSEMQTKRIQIPTNTFRVVMELYISYHGNDEFWYSNPPYEYIRINNLTTERGNGAFREVFVTIDGKSVGSVVPFPVIFTGGINPLFWEPVVAIGAFNLPSYDLDLTPFLGWLLDGKNHEFGIGVNKGISYWLVNANLHLWLDHGPVEATSVVHHSQALSIQHHEEIRGLDGSFRVEAMRINRFSGWTKSSAGNFTVIVSYSSNVSNVVSFERNGAQKMVKQRVHSKKATELRSESGEVVAQAVHESFHPLHVITSTLQGLRQQDKVTYLLVTNVSHALNESYSDGEFLRSLNNSQDSNGWMEVEGHSVLAGEASTTQGLYFSDTLGCYSRTVVASNGNLLRDNSTFSCPSSI